MGFVRIIHLLFPLGNDRIAHLCIRGAIGERGWLHRSYVDCGFGDTLSGYPLSLMSHA